MLSRGALMFMAVVGGLGPAPVSDGTPRVQELGAAGWVYQVLEAEAPRWDEETRWKVAELVADEARANSLEPSLLLAVMKVESRFDLRACSPKGARGLMQLMPHVARAMTGGAATYESLYDPAVNIPLGARLLRALVKQHKGNLPRALAAYNMGSTRVYALMRENIAPQSDLEWRYTRAVLAAERGLKAEHEPRLLANIDVGPMPLMAD